MSSMHDGQINNSLYGPDLDVMLLKYVMDIMAKKNTVS